MIDTKQIVENRYKGVAPEGFVLLLEKTIQDLQDFETWKEWKNKIIELDLNNRIEIEESKKSFKHSFYLVGQQKYTNLLRYFLDNIYLNLVYFMFI